MWPVYISFVTPLYSIACLFLFALVLIVAFGIWRNSRRVSRSFSYVPRPILTVAEAEFFGALSSLLGSAVMICPKVNLADLVAPVSASDKGARWRISQKHLDFVLLRPDDLSVLGVVELDDSSHSTSQARQRDAVKDDALRQASIPICRVKWARQYDLVSLASQLTDTIGISFSAVP